MSAARYHRRKNYSTIILFVVDTTFRKYYPTHF